MVDYPKPQDRPGLHSRERQILKYLKGKEKSTEEIAQESNCGYSLRDLGEKRLPRMQARRLIKEDPITGWWKWWSEEKADGSRS